MKIRPARDTDAAALAAIHRQSVDAQDSTMAGPCSSEEMARRLSDAGEREIWLVLEEEATVIGWGVVKAYSPRPGYHFACETSIFLDRSRRGKGYGRPLQAALLDHCQRLGYHHTVARIWASNQGSIRFHQSFGYELVGIQKEIGFVGGQWRDVAILQKVFH